MRKLAWAAFGFSGAVFAAHYLLGGNLPFWCSLGCALLLLPAPLLRGMARRRWLLALTAAAIGFAWYGAYARWALAPLETIPEEAGVYSARVTRYPLRYDNGTSLTLRLALPESRHVTARVFAYDRSCDALEPGDLISVELKLRPASTRYGEETDSDLSQGIFLRGTVTQAPTVLGRWKWSVLCLPQRVAHRLEQTASEIFPADTAAFARALMLGEKSRLYAEDLDLPLQNAGIFHAVAVSGMHLAFLIGAVQLLFGRRRFLALLSLPMLWIFALMAGASPSVLRAAFMASVLLLAPALERENDPATSLLTPLSILLLCQPFSAGSASLQLSFASMAGILALSGPVYRAMWSRWYPSGRAPGPVGHFALTAIATSAGSMAATLPLCAARFGTVVLSAPLTNLLVLWVLPAAFLGCYAAVLSGLVWPALGRGLAWCAAWPLRYVLAVAKWASLLPGTRLDGTAPLTVVWLSLVYLIAGAVILSHRRGKPMRPVIPICCCVLTLALIGLFARWRDEAVPTLTALDVGQGQCLLFRAGRSSVMVDCGGTATAENAGDIAARALLRGGREALDLLVLTHPHEDHINGARRLLLQTKVRALILPAAADPDTPMLRSLLETARARGTAVYPLSGDARVELGELRLDFFVSLGVDKEDGCLMTRVSCGDYDTLVTGDVDTETETLLVSNYDLTDTELLIAGHHGSKYASGDALLDALGAGDAVISCGYNHYGHPAPETLERLERRGITVWRTDQLGNVTIRME